MKTLKELETETGEHDIVGQTKIITLKEFVKLIDEMKKRYNKNKMYQRALDELKTKIIGESKGYKKVKLGLNKLEKFRPRW